MCRRGEACTDALPESGCAAIRDVVEVHQNGGDPLPAVGTESATGIRMGVDSVVMFDIALAVSIARDLRQLHVPERLVRERLDPLQQGRTWVCLLGQMAREARASLCRLTSWASVA